MSRFPKKEISEVTEISLVLFGDIEVRKQKFPGNFGNFFIYILQISAVARFPKKKISENTKISLLLYSDIKVTYISRNFQEISKISLLISYRYHKINKVLDRPTPKKYKKFW